MSSQTAEVINMPSFETGTEPAPVDIPFVHIHIPKTAGTSIRKVFETALSPQDVLVYDYLSGTMLYSSERTAIPPRFTRQYEVVKKAIAKAGLSTLMHKGIYYLREHEHKRHGIDFGNVKKSDFKVLTGHFTGQQVIDSGLDESKDVVSVVRQPLERVWSHYRHWERSSGETFGEHFGPYKSRRQKNFEEHALGEDLTNFQTKWLGSVGLASVGVLSHFNEFIESIGMKNNATEQIHANRDSQTGELPALDLGFVREFEELNREDYEFYEKSLDSWR